MARRRGDGRTRLAPANRRIVRPDFSSVHVARSGVHGRGLFAARGFAKGARIMEYGGVKVPKREGQRRTDAQWAKGRIYMFELSRRFDLDGSPRWNVARLANQSCDPNCESQNEGGRHIWIVALRRIRKGEELTYDYNFPMMEPPPPCRCGARNCRGYMVGEEALPELNRWLREHGKPEVGRRAAGKAATRKAAVGKTAPGAAPAGTAAAGGAARTAVRGRGAGARPAKPGRARKVERRAARRT